MTMKQPENSKDRKMAAEFNEIAKTIFAPVYPVLAGNILNQTEAKGGICLDLGSGPAHLAIAVSAASGFDTVSLDFNPFAQELALENIAEAGLSGRVRPVRGDVHHLPFKDNSIDLVVSRGSIFFWDSPREVFTEVHRVLRPGGRSFIGGGFGTAELKAEIQKKMSRRDGDFRGDVGKRMSPENLARLKAALESSAAVKSRVYRDEANLWFIIEKEQT